MNDMTEADMDELLGEEMPAPKKKPGRKPGRKPQQKAQKPKTQRLQRTGPQIKAYEPDKTKIPRGMVYQWLAKSIYGQEDVQVAQTLNHMYRNHWKPVPANRHPEIFGEDAGQESGIIGGLMLCERPDYLNKEARAEEKANAQAQLREKIRSLNLDDPRDRGYIEKSRPYIRAGYSPFQRVADDE